MADPAGGGPSSVPASSTTTTTTVTAAAAGTGAPPVFLDAEKIAENARLVEKLTESYREFSKILGKEGAAAALAYARAFNEVMETNQKAADSVAGFSEALARSATNARSNLQAIKESIIEESQASVALEASIGKLIKAQEEFAKTSTDPTGFINSLKLAEEQFKGLIDSFSMPLKLDIFAQLEEARGEIGKLKEDVKQDFLSGADLENTTYFKEKVTQLVLGGKNVDQAKQIAKAVLEKLKAEVTLSEATETLSADEQAAAKTALELSIARDKLTASTIRLNNAQEATPAAKLELILKDSLEGTNKALTDNIDKLTGATGKLGLFGNAILALQSGSGIGGLSKALSEGLTNALFTPEKAVLRLVNFIDTFLIKSTFDFDKTLAGVNKTTGGFREEFEKIAMNKGGVFSSAKTAELAVYGINLDKLGKAYGDLSKNIAGFNHMTDESRRLLTEQAAKFENLGLSASEYGKTASVLMGVFNIDAKSAKERIESLADAAIAAGRNVGEYVGEFEKLSKNLVGFGRDAQQIFRELNAISQTTKGVLSTSDITNLADKFTNLESATSAVRNLNSALGTATLNPMALLGKDASEIATQLKEAFDATGKSFDNFNIGYKRQLAELFGNDMNKASAFFKMNLSDINTQMGQQSDKEKERNKRLQESITATEKFKTAIESMKLSFSPMLAVLTKIAETISSVVNTIKPGGAFLIAITGLTVGVQLAFRKLKQGITNMFTEIFKRAREELAAFRADAAAPIPTPSGGPAPSTPGGGPATPPPGGSKWLGAAKGVGIAVGIAALGFLASKADDSFKEAGKKRELERKNKDGTLTEEEEKEYKSLNASNAGSGGALRVTASGSPILPNIGGSFSGINTTNVSSPQEKNIMIGNKKWKVSDSDEIFAYDPKADKLPGVDIAQTIMQQEKSLFSILQSSMQENFESLEKNEQKFSFIDTARASSIERENKNFQSLSTHQQKVEAISRAIERTSSDLSKSSTIEKIILQQVSSTEKLNKELVENIKNINIHTGPVVLHEKARRELIQTTVKESQTATAESFGSKVPYISHTG